MKNCFWCYFRQLFIAEVQRPEGAGDPELIFPRVIIASGIDCGCVRTMKPTESRKMAAILQLISSQTTSFPGPFA